MNKNAFFLQQPPALPGCAKYKEKSYWFIVTFALLWDNLLMLDVKYFASFFKFADMPIFVILKHFTFYTLPYSKLEI